MSLKYGPVGDPASSDPFERAQARMPEGWHVEGQQFSGRMRATTKTGDQVTGDGPLDLIAKVRAKHFDKPHVKNSRRDPSLSKMSGAELSRTLAKALRTPGDRFSVKHSREYVDATAFGDINKTFLVGMTDAEAVVTTNATTAGGEVITTTNTVSWPATGQQWVLEDTYLWTEGDKPSRIGATRVTEKSDGDETDMAWLARRVREICWVPA